MPFPYYRRLSRKAKAIYRKSAAITEIVLPAPVEQQPLATALRRALAAGDRIAVEQAAHDLVDSMDRALGVAPVSIRVLSSRPRSTYGELHGLYTREEGERPVIQVWMRTAAHAKVVAFPTFLRTLLHEVLHHLDYELLELEDSLHTEGFFRRESSLMRQLVPAARKTAAAAVEAPAPAKRKRRTQLDLPW